MTAIVALVVGKYFCENLTPTVFEIRNVTDIQTHKQTNKQTDKQINNRFGFIYFLKMKMYKNKFPSYIRKSYIFDICEYFYRKNIIFM